jgi:hypothetical protein
MLRVTYSETDGGQRWILCGRLAGPWVDELRSCWRQAHERTPRARIAVDLNEVTFIDPTGAELLREMKNAGAKFAVAGVENKHLLEAMNETQPYAEGGQK